MKQLYKNKVARIFVIVCIAVFALCACTTGISNAPLKLSKDHQIIFDTDTAADDAMAMIFAAIAPNVTIKGVTVLAGNVSLDQAASNALMTMEVAGANDIPVYKGSSTRLNGDEIQCYSVFGEDGMGDCNLIHPENLPETDDAVNFIINTVHANPGDIEIVATGPLTNIAKAIEKAPATMSKVKRIWSMSTGGIGMKGNASPIAEFNVYLDAPAYEVVLESGIPMTIVGLDVCADENLLVGEDELKNLSEYSECGEFIAKSMAGVMKYYKKDGKDKVDLCDPILATALIWDDFILESEKCKPVVLTDKDDSEGGVMFYQKSEKYNFMNVSSYNAIVATKLNSSLYKDLAKALLTET